MQSFSPESQTWRIHPRRTAALVALIATVLASVCVMSAASASPAAAADEVVGFDDAAAPDRLAPVVADSVDGAVVSRFATIETDELLAGLASEDVSIALFDDVTVHFGGSGDLTIGEAGNFTWSATTPDALATLSFADDGVRGSVSVGATTYSIVPASGSTHLIFEEGRSLPNETEAVTPPAGEIEFAADAPSPTPALDAGPTPASDGSAPVVRVLTVYDDFSRDYYGGDAAAVAWLSATIDEVNAAYVRSGANVVMQSAAIEHVDYLGSGVPGSAQTELNRITGTTDGFLDAVHGRRDALGADLVVLVARLDSMSTCGIGWLLRPPVAAGDAAFGFSVVEPRCARENLTFAHETGHNLGAGHGPPDPVPVVPYANGYRNTMAGYRTIMAYNDQSACPGGVCQRVAHYSSPTVLYNGQPTGSPTQDNARVLSELAPSVALYRGGGAIVSLSPARLLDSRVGGATVDGVLAGVGVRGAGSVTEVQVTGRGGVPAGAAAAVLNVTVVQARAGGYATVFPCGEGVPNASNLNFVAGQTVPNAVVAKLGVGGKVCVFAEVPFDLLVDVNGYVPAGSSVGSLSPARLLDSRVGGATVDGVLAGVGVRGAGSVTEVQVTGRGGVPAGAAAAVLNVTVVQARAGGYATVFPCGEGVPNASNLNFVAGQTVPNAVVAKLGVGGKVCVFAEVPFDLLVDVNGYVPAGSSVGSLSPARLLDSRVGGATVDGVLAGVGVRGAGSVTEVQVTGRGGVPAGAAAAVLNVTVVQARAGGYATVFPCGEGVPNASNLNFVAGQTVPNAVVAKLGVGGKVCVFAEVPFDLLVDVNGSVAA